MNGRMRYAAIVARSRRSRSTAISRSPTGSRASASSVSWTDAAGRPFGSTHSRRTSRSLSRLCAGSSRENRVPPVTGVKSAATR